MSEPTPLGQAAASYLEQEVQNDSPLGLIVRLYDTALLDIKRARVALQAQDWQAKGAAIRRAANCISMLQASLNLEKGGEVGLNLDRIYSYLLVRLTEAHLRDDEAVFSEIAKHLGELGEAWRIAARGATQPAEAAAPAGEAGAVAAR